MQLIAPSVEQNTEVEQNYRHCITHCYKVAAPVVDAAVDISSEVPDLDSIAAVTGLDALSSILRLPHHKLYLPPGTGTVVVVVLLVKVVVEKQVPVVADVGCHHGSVLPKPSQQIQDFLKGW
ncbi:hypothetical protein L2E82_17596 [Cichorium intybus]|uniref:Uncharacterized protein n=1 Tax=Cichorium intybus TaxID=13427 RepID=A0ACB9F922_CICIN|nr:hypothetical protein L2E82_17596 [Cichorium intybus]